MYQSTFGEIEYQSASRDIEHQSTSRDIEYHRDNELEKRLKENTDGDQTQWAPNRSSRPSKGKLTFVDSSGPFFSIYSKAVEEEDNKMVERWQEDAKWIFLFSGLFSIAVAVLLVVTIQNLRPSSQDTSAFYLGNIYQVLADPNATRASIPSSVANPPSFTPPRYAVWVNSLLFLSLVMSVICGLMATSVHHWARRYIRLTRPARCSPEKRARARAFYANGVDKMHMSWAVEGIQTLLHLSMFLFLCGLAIFLFNVDREVFVSVVWCIGLFSIVYGSITLLPSIQLDSPYSTPFSTSAWFLASSIRYVTFKALAFTARYVSIQTWVRVRVLSGRYRAQMLGGMEKRAEETMLKQSSEIDIHHTLGWTINSLGDDDSLEKFFEAIPGLFNSKLLKDLEIMFPEDLFGPFWGALYGLMDRTLSSNSDTGSTKSRRIRICEDIMSKIPCPESYMSDIYRPHFDQVQVSIQSLEAMAQWFPHKSLNVSYAAQIGVAKNLARVQERDDRWVALASEMYGLPDVKTAALSWDDAMLAVLIRVCRDVKHSDELGLVEAATRFNILRTLPELQHKFCTLWNDLFKEARSFNIPVHILRLIRRHYIALHPGTDAGRTAILSPTDPDDPILLHESSYPRCNIDSHQPGPISPVSSTSAIALSHFSASSGSTADMPISIRAPSTSASNSLMRQQRSFPAGIPPDKAPTSLDSSAVPSPLSRYAGISPLPDPSRAPPQYVGNPVQVPLYTSSSHSIDSRKISTTESIAYSSNLSFPVPTTWTGTGGSLEQMSAEIPPFIKLDPYGGVGRFSGLLPYSFHPVRYQNNLYPTALHLFEARKFLPHRQDLGKRVRQCERVQDISTIVKELTVYVRPDWAYIAAITMDDVLYLKFCQHSALHTLLVSTYSIKLVYFEPGDLFWGGDGESVGRNVFGKSLMRVRQRLRTEAGL